MFPNSGRSATIHLEQQLSPQVVGYIQLACHRQQEEGRSLATTLHIKSDLIKVNCVNAIRREMKYVLNTSKDDGVSILTSPSSSFTCTVTPRGTRPGGYNAHLFKDKGDNAS